MAAGASATRPDDGFRVVPRRIGDAACTMSAVNIFKAQRALHILSDGAACGPDGVLRCLRSRVAPLPHLGCALALRGPPSFLDVVSWFAAMAPAQSFEDLAGLFEDVVGQAVRTASGPDATDVEVFLAGLAGDGSPHILAVRGRLSGGGSTLHHLGRCIAPSDAGEFGRRLREAVDLDAPNFNPVRDGVRLVERQREFEGGIGGFVQLTTIMQEGISTRILHRWPDVVGEVLGPRGPALAPA